MISDKNELESLLNPFPPHFKKNSADKSNPAISLYGRRFYKDQPPVEYLAEFLLVFASPKQDPQSVNDHRDAYCFTAPTSEKHGTSGYWAEYHVALKLFAFFPGSRLETRHPVHQKAYLNALNDLKAKVSGSIEKKEETVRLLQSLLSGFVGVAKNRTWVTYSFLPVSSAFLSKEVTWNHPDAMRKKVHDWDSSKNFFDKNTRNFMGRGGELLFVQLANLFSEPNNEDILAMLSDNAYRHLKDICVIKLAQDLEGQLQNLLEQAVEPLANLARLIEDSLSKYQLTEEPQFSDLGWTPKVTRIEALLFAHEMKNICTANVSSLEKFDLLQTLCCMQVLRSLCFQARRLLNQEEKITHGFIGDFSWIVSDQETPAGTPIRLMAQNSFSRIDAMLYRAIECQFLHIKPLDRETKDKVLENAHDNCFRHFRKLTKEIGLVTPRKGNGQRFVLTPELLRFLVAALLQPGERVRLTEFYRRAFAHYGLALGGDALNAGLEWCGNAGKKKSYAVAVDTLWIEEALQQGGFLVELSDAVSMVYNPGTARKSA